MEERLRKILKIALQYGVTDVHFNIKEEIGKEMISIEMRVDGQMKRIIPSGVDTRLFRYLCYRANLDVSDTFQPQTGSFSESIDGRNLSLRFAVVSSYQMKSGVLRILNNHRELRIDDLTQDQYVKKWMKKITETPDGLYIFSGPTGSGKTTSLYTILNACQGKKIFTLEDPVEVVNEKYVQLQINEAMHLSYAEGIRQLMRHDPDIIMIGEIRDDIAAQMAVRCALTGHLVVTSLHSSSCVSAILRMLDLGVKKYQLEDILRGVSNQRLYDYPNGMKTGVYEVMNEKEVKYYFENGTTSRAFKDLSFILQEAGKKGIILPQMEKTCHTSRRVL